MRTMMLSLTVLCLGLAARDAGAQRPEPVGISAAVAIPAATMDVTARAQRSSAAVAMATAGAGMPGWVRWGIIGALGGAVLFTLLDSGRSHSVASDVFTGAATGFVVLGGGVLLYDVLCKPESGGGGSAC